MKRTSRYLFILTVGCIVAYINFSYDNNTERIAPSAYVPYVSMKDIIAQTSQNTEQKKTEASVAKEEAPNELEKGIVIKQKDMVLKIIEELEESKSENEIFIEQVQSEDKSNVIEMEQVVEKEQEEEALIADHNYSNSPTRGDDIKRAASNASSKSINSYVLDIIKTYKIGSYPYLLNNDYSNYNGVTENLYYNGEILLKAESSGSKASHCSGITFEVFYKAMQQRNTDLGLGADDFSGLTKDDLFDMALTWYAAKGPKSKYNIATAVEKYGMGYRITDMENLRAGDFLDFSRTNNTGHTVVFLNWIRDDNNEIIGFKYWSSQESTNGINYNEEYFNILNSDGKGYGSVIIDNLHMARIVPK